MSSLSNNAVRRIELLYLKEEQADVWFVFENERIPAHKLILSTISPWLNTMFFGSMPEGKEVNMTHATITSDAFKEFLQFFYTDKVKLTIKNIEGVIDLAKQSLNDHIFIECEEFLTKSITTDTMCFGYQLALRYGAPKLKKLCEEEICVNAEQVLRSSSFMEFPYEFLHQILQCDALACDEIDVFNACIAWAKADCSRKEKDPSKAENLRAQLKNSVYQIRFISMTKEEVANCIGLCSGLFDAGELEEIIRMIGGSNSIKKCNTMNKFNWTPRYFDLQWNKGRELECRRLMETHNVLTPTYKINEVEITLFSCNRRILLRGFNCECNQVALKSANIEIIEISSNGDESVERYQEETTLNFIDKRDYLLSYGTIFTLNNVKCYSTSYEAIFTLNKAILLRPKYEYIIKITFKPEDTETDSPLGNDTVYKTRTLLDFDILIKFNRSRGIISSLHLNRFDDKNLIRKLIRTPLTWYKSVH